MDANLNLNQEALDREMMTKNYLWGLCPYCGEFLLERHIDDPINDIFRCPSCDEEIWMGDQDYPDDPDQEEDMYWASLYDAIYGDGEKIDQDEIIFWEGNSVGEIILLDEDE